MIFISLIKQAAICCIKVMSRNSCYTGGRCISPIRTELHLQLLWTLCATGAAAPPPLSSQEFDIAYCMEADLPGTPAAHCTDWSSLNQVYWLGSCQRAQLPSRQHSGYCLQGTRRSSGSAAFTASGATGS